MKSWVAKFLRSRWRMVVLLLEVLCIGIAIVGLFRIHIESDIDKLFRTPDPVLDGIRETFALADDDLFLIVYDDKAVLTPSRIDCVANIHRKIQEVDGVHDAISLVSLRSKRRAGRYLLPIASSRALRPERWEKTREALLRHPLSIGNLLSADTQATVISIRVPEEKDVSDVTRVIQEIQSIAHEEMGQLPSDEQMQFVVSGNKQMHGEIHRLMQRDQRVFVVGGLLLGGLIGAWLFRNAFSVLLLNAGCLGVVATLGLMGLVGIPMTVMNTVIPVVIVIVGYADAVHLMLEIRRQLPQHDDAVNAISLSVQKVWLACLLTSITTAIGFGSLMISDVVAIREFGLMTAFGCIANFFFIQLTIPILASYWPDGLSEHDPSKAERFQTSSNWIARFVDKRSRAIVATCGLLTVVSIAMCFGLRSQNRLADYLPAESNALVSYDRAQQSFGGVGSIYVLVEWDEDLRANSPDVLAALALSESVMLGFEELGVPRSMLQLLQSLPGDTNFAQGYQHQFRNLKYIPREHRRVFVDPASRRSLVASRIPDIGASEVTRLSAAIQSRLDQVPTDGIHYSVVGPTVSMSRSFVGLIHDLGSSLFLATALIFVLMSLLFRSPTLGLISAVPNALALCCVGAFLVATDTPLQMVSVLCFSVCLGISVDDTIHFMLRYLDERRTETTARQAALNTVRRIGPAFIVTTLVFVGGNLIVMLSRIPVLSLFGQLSCLSLILAVIADLIFLPALVLRWDRRPVESRTASRATPSLAAQETVRTGAL